jgi:hypothetical protein
MRPWFRLPIMPATSSGPVPLASLRPRFLPPATRRRLIIDSYTRLPLTTFASCRWRTAGELIHVRQRGLPPSDVGLAPSSGLDRVRSCKYRLDAIPQLINAIDEGIDMQGGAHGELVCL